MTGFRLGLRSAVFYWRSHLSVLAGTMLAGAVLTGAMLVGDSVKYSLKQAALFRLGNVYHALNTPGRFFGQDLADRVEDESDVHVAPVLQVRGMAMLKKDAGEDVLQVNNVQVYGIDDRFWAFAMDYGAKLSDDSIVINSRLAAELGAKKGDSISIRIEKPSLLSKDAPLSSRKGDDTVRGTFVVKGIVPDNQLGRFSLSANQIVPYNAFVSLAWLQKNISLEGRANLLLAAGKAAVTDEELAAATRNAAPNEKVVAALNAAPRNIRAERLNAEIAKVWRIEDAGLSLVDFESKGLIQLESNRIFMDPSISRVALAVDNAAGALTYLVNSISKTNRGSAAAIPYSFVEALSSSAGIVPQGMKDDEIVLSRWLADCLSAGQGDSVQVSYSELLPSGNFVDRTRMFRVVKVVEMAELRRERELCPRFPGLTDVEKCSEWDIGMPLDKAKVEDKANEAYWKEFGATPKAFVTLKAGQEMWANRFGDLTAVRFSADRAGRDLIAETLRSRIKPAELGLSFVPVRETALKAAGDAMDFGQLFLGMSFFLIVAGLMLTGLLFAFGIQQRSEEIGILFAVGYRPGQVRRLLVQESCLVAGCGALAGALIGTLYTRVLVWGLANFWQGAIANSMISYHAEPATAWTGGIATFLCAMLSLVIAMRKQSARPARELISGDTGGADFKLHDRYRLRTGLILSLSGVVVALGLIGFSILTGMQNAVETFFMAGALLLLAGLGLVREFFAGSVNAEGRLSVAALGRRNAGRRMGRSLTAAGLLACGCFMVFAVSSMQEDVGAHAEKRTSGTGGFAFYGESTVPIQGDLNSIAGRAKFKLDREPLLKDATIVSMKVRDGDDASCLNLNRAQSPRLIGVAPGDFISRKAFVSQGGGDGAWGLLEMKLPDGVVPGLAGDANTAMWGLERKTGVNGDLLDYRDEMGRMFKVKLVGTLPMRLSVLQGTMLISAGAFAGKYPSESGYRAFLVDAPQNDAEKIREVLMGCLSRHGVDFVSTVARLKEFYAVESTYMAMFLVLGGLGLLLGSAGMGIIVLRNILERRKELAMLEAVGYAVSDLRRLVFAEHWLIVVLGLTVGAVASLAAMWPSFQAPGVRLPYGVMLMFLGGVTAFQLAWIAASIWMALRQSLISALRNE